MRTLAALLAAMAFLSAAGTPSADPGDDVFRAYANPIWVAFDDTSVAEDHTEAPLSISPSRNPFRGETSFDLVLPAAGPAVLSVHDASGHLVKNLNTGWSPAGPRTVTWDGTDSSGRPVASGVYLVRLKAQAGAVVAKCVLVR